MIELKTRQNWVLYSDDSIQAEIWKAVCQDDGIRLLEIDSFSVSVKDGFVLLAGHVSKKYHRELIEAIACSVPGVHAVQNKLVADSDLTIQVAAHLSMDERTRHFIFPVGSAHGWVRLGGVVPRRALQRATEEIVAQVPSVRGVLSRPRLIGEYPETERHPVQPGIQAKVYDYNLQEGVVTQVVIQPRNRLVTHAVVSASDFQDGKFIFHEYLIPLEALEAVNRESIFLKRKGSHLNTFPAFDASVYPLAPSDWQPPYPYKAETVRWPCEEQERAESQSNSSRSFRRRL
jgi:osmotically-inducible protein OsmY